MPDAAPQPGDPLSRGRRSIGLNLKDPVAVDVLLQLAGTADVLVEGFRPGVTERLGLGPDACLARNPRLVYGRLTGWGQDGPLSLRAGHDIPVVRARHGPACGAGPGPQSRVNFSVDSL